MKTYRIIGTVLSALLLTAWASASRATLVGYWNFNEGTGQLVADSSGLSNTGTLGASTSVESTDPVWTAAGGGRTGAAGDYALTFDGATSFRRVTVNDPGTGSSLDIGGTGWNDAMTISAWVKGSTSYGGPGTIASKHGGLPGNFQYSIDGTYQRLDMSDATNVSLYSEKNSISSALPTDSLWHEVAMVVQENGSNQTTIQFYLDGATYGTLVTTGGGDNAHNFGYTDNTQLWLGYRGDTAWPFNGTLDDVAIWNHALNPAQLAQLGAGTRSVLDIVPEPSTILLLGVGGLLVGRRYRRSRH